MIQKSSYLKVIDNSGAKVVSCIDVGKGFKKKVATLGDIITVSIKTLRNNRKLAIKVNKGDICKALIVRTKMYKKNFLSKDSFWFNENSVVLLNKQKKFLFTRIFGGLSSHFRNTKFIRILSLSTGVSK